MTTDASTSLISNASSTLIGDGVCRAVRSLRVLLLGRLLSEGGSELARPVRALLVRSPPLRVFRSSKKGKKSSSSRVNYEKHQLSGKSLSCDAEWR